MKKMLLLIILAATAVMAQTATPEPTGDGPLMTIMDVAAPASFVLAEVARKATDYTWTGPITGRVYHISARQEVALTGAVVGIAMVVRHTWPKSRKVVDGVLSVTAGAFAGMAYAQSQQAH